MYDLFMFYYKLEYYLFVSPFLWLVGKKAKQLSTPTTPLCFSFFRCRVDVLQS